VRAAQHVGRSHALRRELALPDLAVEGCDRNAMGRSRVRQTFQQIFAEVRFTVSSR
jgi:hypothetical protein